MTCRRTALTVRNNLILSDGCAERHGTFQPVPSLTPPLWPVQDRL